jgi:AcrR family transcriptional regulator
MSDRAESGRLNQRTRTRKDLLAAAARLLKQGATPGMDEVAAEAMVSRATAYRYFPSIEALLVEAPLDGDFPDARRVFGEPPAADPRERVDRAEAALHDMTYRNAPQLRTMLAASVDRRDRGDGVPLRQNRRTGLIEAALEPARGVLDVEAFTRLCAALAVYFGPESMVVFADVLDMDEQVARRVKSWAVRALVNAALEQAAAGAAQQGTPPIERGA